MERSSQAGDDRGRPHLHPTQPEAAAPLYVMGGQGRHWAALVAPVSGWYVPGSHSKHAVRPSSNWILLPQWPTGQGRQSETAALPVRGL